MLSLNRTIITASLPEGSVSTAIHPVDVFGRFDRLRLFPRFERLGLLLFEAVDLLLDLLQEFAHVVDALGLQGRGRAGEKKGGEKITQFHRVCVLVSLNQN